MDWIVAKGIPNYYILFAGIFISRNSSDMLDNTITSQWFWEFRNIPQTPPPRQTIEYYHMRLLFVLRAMGRWNVKSYNHAVIISYTARQYHSCASISADVWKIVPLRCYYNSSVATGNANSFDSGENSTAVAFLRFRCYHGQFQSGRRIREIWTLVDSHYVEVRWKFRKSKVPATTFFWK
jgi:hypothetical protein